MVGRGDRENRPVEKGACCNLWDQGKALGRVLPEARLSAPCPSPECGPHFLSHPQFQIRALESQKRQQELVLRRKTQEVSAAPPRQPPSPD